MPVNPHVLYVTRFVPGYRVPILESLSERIPGGLTVASGHPPGQSSFDSLTSEGCPSYGQISTANRWVGGERLHWQHLGAVWTKLPPNTIVLFEESPRTLSLPFAMASCRRRGWPIILWGHFVSRHRASGSPSVRDRYRIWLASRADALVTYSEGLRQELQQQSGLPGVFAAPNTLESTSLTAKRDELSRRSRAEMRRELGLRKEAPCLLFIGRLIEEKGVWEFLEVLERLSASETEYQAVVIGDGPEAAGLASRAVEKGLDVHFPGAISDPLKAAPWLAASDVLLNPGYVGLSLNHAMLMGTPVVAPEPPPHERFHSPEWDFLVDGENGVKAKTDSVDDLVAAVGRVFQDREGFRQRTIDFADAHLSSSRMIDGLLAAIRHVSVGTDTP